MGAARSGQEGSAVSGPDFLSIYDMHAPFVWRAAVRLGVGASSVEDVVQEIFLVVHRRLRDYDGRASLRSWLYGIAIHVARRHRRTTYRRRLLPSAEDPDLDLAAIPAPPSHAPDVLLENAEAERVAVELLDALTESEREVFVLHELEEWSAPRIAEVLSVNVNTVYSRLRAARRSLEAASKRHRARTAWRAPAAFVAAMTTAGARASAATPFGAFAGFAKGTALLALIGACVMLARVAVERRPPPVEVVAAPIARAPSPPTAPVVVEAVAPAPVIEPSATRPAPSVERPRPASLSTDLLHLREGDRAALRAQQGRFRVEHPGSSLLPRVDDACHDD